jgi:hypothetical protein
LALVDTTLQDFWWVPFITLCALWNWPEVIWMTWSWAEKGDLFLFYFMVLEFELRAYTLSHSTRPFSYCVFLR